MSDAVLNTGEAFVLDVLLEATQPTQSPNALIRSLAEQLIETRKQLAATEEELALAAVQLRAADHELETLRLKLTSASSEGSTSVDPEEDPYW